MNISVLKASFGCSLIYKNIWFGRLPFLIEHTRNFSIYKCPIIYVTLGPELFVLQHHLWQSNFGCSCSLRQICRVMPGPAAEVIQRNTNDLPSMTSITRSIWRQLYTTFYDHNGQSVCVCVIWYDLLFDQSQSVSSYLTKSYLKATVLYYYYCGLK